MSKSWIRRKDSLQIGGRSSFEYKKCKFATYRKDEFKEHKCQQ